MSIGQPQGIAPTEPSIVGAILYGCPHEKAYAHQHIIAFSIPLPHPYFPSLNSPFPIGEVLNNVY